MPSNCTTNYIGIRGACTSVSPVSGLYLEDLPGITLDRAAKIAEGFTPTGVEVAQSSIDRGLRRIKRDLIKELSPIVRFNSVTFSRLASKYRDDEFLAATATASGIKAELCSSCRLLGMYVPYVNVQLEDTVSATLTITEGADTKTYSVSAIAGETVCVQTNYRPTISTIQITLEAGVKPNDSLLNRSCFVCPALESCEGEAGAGVKITGVGADTNKSYGVQPLINLECSPNKLFCETLHLIQDAALYACGYEFMCEAISTDRLNDFTVYRMEDAESLKQEWREEYVAELSRVAATLPKFLNQIDNCCLECNSDHWTYSLP